MPAEKQHRPETKNWNLVRDMSGLKELHQKDCRAYDHKILKLQGELADAHKETIRVRNYWFQILEDMLVEFEQAQKKAEQELRIMEMRALKAEKQRDEEMTL